MHLTALRCLAGGAALFVAVSTAASVTRLDQAKTCESPAPASQSLDTASLMQYKVKLGLRSREADNRHSHERPSDFLAGAGKFIIERKKNEGHSARTSVRGTGFSRTRDWAGRQQAPRITDLALAEEVPKSAGGALATLQRLVGDLPASQQWRSSPTLPGMFGSCSWLLASLPLHFTWHHLVSFWGLGVVIWIGGQLWVLRRLGHSAHSWMSEGDKEHLTSLEAIWRQGRPEQPESWAERWAWPVVGWAGSLFATQSDGDKAGGGAAAEAVVASTGSEAPALAERFWACWADEVDRLGKPQEVELVWVLKNFIGLGVWVQLFFYSVCSVAINSAMMVLGLEALVDHIAWLAKHKILHAEIDLLPSCVMCILLGFALPLFGAGVEARARLCAGRASVQLMLGLSTAVHEKAMRSPQLDCGERLSVDALEVSRDIVRTVMQATTAPVGVVVLLALLWSKVGAAVVVAIAALILLLWLTRTCFRDMVLAQVDYQVAAAKRSRVLHGLLGALPDTNRLCWEEPISRRMQDLRREELQGASRVQGAGLRMMLLSSSWPRLLLLALALCCAWMGPKMHGRAIIALLFLLSCLVRNVSTAAIGFTRLRGLSGACNRLEAFFCKEDAFGRPARGRATILGGSRPLAIRSAEATSGNRQASAPGPPHEAPDDSRSGAVDAEPGQGMAHKSQGLTCTGAMQTSGSAKLSSLHFYLRHSGCCRFVAYLALVIGSHLIALFLDLSLVEWAIRSKGLRIWRAGSPAGWYDLDPSLLTCLACGCAYLALEALSTMAGVLCSCSFAGAVHHKVIAAMFRNPVDRLFSFGATNQQANQLNADFARVDLHLWLKLSGLISVSCGLVCSLAFVHAVLPLAFSLAAVPVIILAGAFLLAFAQASPAARRNSEVALQQLQIELSKARCLAKDSVAHCRYDASAVRCLNVYANAHFVESVIGTQWLLQRIAVCSSTLLAFAGLAAVLAPGAKAASGPSSLALALCALVLHSVETVADPLVAARGDLLAVERLRLRAEVSTSALLDTCEKDLASSSYSIRLEGKGCGALRTEGSGAALQILNQHGCILFRSSDDGEVLVTASAGLDTLGQLDKTKNTADEHHVVSVNGINGSAELMAQELCAAGSAGANLELRRGRSRDGTNLEIQSLYVAEGNEPRLTGLSIQIKPRMKVGLRAASDADGTKEASALLLTLARAMRPQRGRVLLDGVDLSNLSALSLASAVGFAPRAPLILDGSLRATLDPSGVFGDEALRRALCVVGLGRLLAERGGLDAQLRSEELTLGNRQLLSLARLVLQQPPLALLDDALSGLDGRTQASTYCALWSALKRSTVLFWSAAPEAFLSADKVLMFDAGRIVEAGTPADLKVNSDRIFSGMVAPGRVAT